MKVRISNIKTLAILAAAGVSLLATPLYAESAADHLSAASSRLSAASSTQVDGGIRDGLSILISSAQGAVSTADASLAGTFIDQAVSMVSDARAKGLVESGLAAELSDLLGRAKATL